MEKDETSLSNLSRLFKWVHNKIMHDKRVQFLAEEILTILPPVNRVLDVGCGDGKLVRICNLKSNSKIRFVGIDKSNRYNTQDLLVYDGNNLPYEDNSFDACMLCDVLHHLISVDEIIKEVKRVSANYIIIKDHLYRGPVDYCKLAIMDFVGNVPYGIETIYKFKTEQQWIQICKEQNLEILAFKKEVRLYQSPLSWFFGAHLHCLLLLRVSK